MRKLLLLFTATASMFTASAAANNAKLNAPAAQQEATEAQSRADNVFQIRFCGDIASYESFEEDADIRAYIYVTPERATQLAGNKLTSISYAVTLNYGQGGSTPGTIFVSEDLDAEPIYSMNITINDSYSQPTAQIQEGAFSRRKQYEIKAGVGFYFGFTMHCSEKDFPLALDGNPANEFAGMMDFYDASGEMYRHFDIGEVMGHNLVLFATTEGSGEMEDAFSVGDFRFGKCSLPIFSNLHPVAPQLYFENKGSNALTSVEYDYYYSDGSAGTATTEINVPAHSSGYYDVPLYNSPAGRRIASITINKVNGKAIQPVSTSISYFSIGDTEGYPRKFVVEEGTGTWCGYCPVGIYGFEYMEKHFPGDFIGIALHAANNDPWPVPAYNPLINAYFPGFPSCIVNRDPAYVDTPAYGFLEESFNEWSNQVAPGEVEMDITVDDKWINIDATTVFAMDDPGYAYNVIFVITENGLVGRQTNYYSGGQYDASDCPDWEFMNTVVTWTYTHVAKAINDCWGADATKMWNVEAGKKYTSAIQLPVSCISKDEDGNRNIQNAYAIALLIDDKTGIIVNATKVRVDGTIEGIDSAVSDDENGPATYYDLQGIATQHPRNGYPYIKVQGKKVSKIIYHD